jgi:hypothetical protein
MASLTQDTSGFKARRKLPRDVREDYGRLYGQRHEVKFFLPASTAKVEARRQFNEWSAEVDGRILTIRAARDGTGQSLTSTQARALAGEWYDWWTVRHTQAVPSQVEDWRDAVQEALYSAVTEEEVKHIGLDKLWRDRDDLRESVRPVLSDIGETAQFLAVKRITLTSAGRNLFLDWLYHDLGAAIQGLLRRSEGDFSPDEYAKRFPKSAEPAESGLTPWELFERWVTAKNPKLGTVETWR